MMKNIKWSVLILIGLVCSSVSAQNGFLVKANMKNMPDGKVIFTYRDPIGLEKMMVDSVESHGGVFEFRGTIPSSDPVFLVMMLKPEGTDMPEPPAKFFISNGDVITVTGDASEWDMAVATGNRYNSELNELYALVNDDKRFLMSSFKQSAANNTGQQGPTIEQKAMQQQLMDKQKNFIKTHPGYLASAMCLFLDMQGALPEKEIKQYYDAFTPAVKQSMYGKLLASGFAFNSKYNSGEATAVVFTKKDMTGRIINLADFKGSYVLLDFWGSWCGPCRAGNPHLKELYAKYKSKGFEIIGIANESGTLAEGTAAWKKAVKEDGLPWINILNEDGKEKINVTSLYEVGAFPTKILLDKNGKIIGRYTGTSASKEVTDPLETKLKEVMGG